MPFRRAHLILLLLVPMIGIAFWPGYFGQVRAAPFALHAHGLSAIAWLLLVELQAWTMSRRRLPLHRTAGLAMFVLVPAFTVGGLLAMQGMAALAAAQSDPFHAHYGVRLALDDALAIAAFLTLVTIAIAQRRRVWVHGGAMIGTVLLVLPPIITRLPVFPGSASFNTVFLIAQGIALTLALTLAGAYPRSRLPFGFVALTIIVQSAAVALLGTTMAWQRVAFALIGVPPVLLALTGVILGLTPLWLAWRRLFLRRPEPGAAAANQEGAAPIAG